MGKFLNGLALISVTALAGCGSGDGEKTDNVALTFYVSDGDRYLQITDDGYANFLKCTVNDGYVVDELITGVYADDLLTLTIFEDEYPYSLTEADGIYTLVGDEETIVLDSVAEVPVTCVNDALEITSFTPEYAEVGVETEFLVNFDYRLASLESAVISAGFTLFPIGGFIPLNATLEISKQGISSGSFVVSTVPKYFNEGDFKLHLAMHQPPVDGDIDIVIEDSVIIDVSQFNSIAPQSIIGSWTQEYSEANFGNDEIVCVKSNYTITDNNIDQSLFYYSDESCNNAIEDTGNEWLGSSGSYIDKGILVTEGGIEARQIEYTFTSKNNGTGPLTIEFVVYANNNKLHFSIKDEDTGEYSFSFLFPYILEI